MKIAFTLNSMTGAPPHEGCVKTMEDVGSLCSDLGQEVVEAGPVLSQDREVYEIGSHFVGRFGDEATLFRLAVQLEAARPWTDRRLKVSAF